MRKRRIQYGTHAPTHSACSRLGLGVGGRVRVRVRVGVGNANPNPDRTPLNLSLTLTHPQRLQEPAVVGRRRAPGPAQPQVAAPSDERAGPRRGEAHRGVQALNAGGVEAEEEEDALAAQRPRERGDVPRDLRE